MAETSCSDERRQVWKLRYDPSRSPRLAGKVEAAFDEKNVDVLVLPGGLKSGTRAPTVAASGGFPIVSLMDSAKSLTG